MTKLVKMNQVQTDMVKYMNSFKILDVSYTSVKATLYPFFGQITYKAVSAHINAEGGNLINLGMFTAKDPPASHLVTGTGHCAQSLASNHLLTKL